MLSLYSKSQVLSNCSYKIKLVLFLKSYKNMTVYIFSFLYGIDQSQAHYDVLNSFSWKLIFL